MSIVQKNHMYLDLGLTPPRYQGIVAFKLETFGSAAHSGYPRLGVSALDPMIEILHDMLHQVTTLPE